MPYEEQRDKENLRKLYTAYANITRDADKAKFLTAHTIQESGWSMTPSGKNNFSNVKELDITKGSMVNTVEDLKAYTHKKDKRIISDEKGLLDLTKDISVRGGSIIYDEKGFPEKNKRGFIKIIDRFKDFESIEDGLRAKVKTIENKYPEAYNATTIAGYSKGLTGYATDGTYSQGVTNVFSGKTLNLKVLGDLVNTTKIRLKTEKQESFQRRENLIKLMNANPAQMEQYSKGVMDAEKQKFDKQAQEISMQKTRSNFTKGLFTSKLNKIQPTTKQE